MNIKRKLFTGMLIIAVFFAGSIKCNVLVSLAPTLLQGAVAMAVKGEASIVTKKGTRIRLTKNMKLSAEGLVLPGARLITGTKSSVDLVFTDSIKVRIGANSSITLDAARLLESKKFTQLKMRLDKGSIFAMTGGKLPKNSSFILTTLKSVVNVRGTEFYVEETGNTNNIIVSSGTVEVTDQSGNNPVYVENGKSAVIGISKNAVINDINEIEKEIMKEMSSDIASLTESDKKQIKEILDRHDENIRLIKEAYEAQKSQIASDVINQKEKDQQNIKMQKDIDLGNVSNVKSSISDDLQRIKNSSKIKKEN